MIYVSEIYPAFQGEGRFIGKPSIFLRLLGCNLDCSWCDSKYTWDKKQIEISGYSKFNTDELVKNIHVYNIINGINHVVVTGGEPLLQQKNLLPVLKWLETYGYTVEFETNGTIRPSDQLLGLSNIVSFNISPKFKWNSAITRDAEYDWQWIEDEVLNGRAIIKVVVRDETQFMRAYEQFVYDLGFPKSSIYFMPEGFTQEQVISSSKVVSGLCVKYGCNFSPRVHILIYSNKRRV